ncbi:MOSC domain-containing protein [Faunimonas sp. B44]|uniref:MOSC domain-containing protein n=1 Tax=Faunimonas sp. B44 TaxID=3461493 RepID=UPI004044B373
MAEIRYYPVKGARGITLPEAEVERRGIAGDRRWMLVDAANRVVTQRELPPLARLRAEPSGPGLRLAFGGEAIGVAQPSAGAAVIATSVWHDAVLLREAAEAGPWLSARFGMPLRLGFQADDMRRPVDPDWGGRAGDEVSLADGFPLLVTSTASLASLQVEVGAPLPMGRFRPSLVIGGAPAWDEDCWRRLQIGEVEIELVKPCARCAVTTVDQEDGAAQGPEPLEALRRIRFSTKRRLPGLLFGWNAVPRRLGRMRVGDVVEVLERGPGWPLRRTSADRG